jgi:hypothetical protein
MTPGIEPGTSDTQSEVSTNCATDILVNYILVIFNSISLLISLSVLLFESFNFCKISVSSIMTQFSALLFFSVYQATGVCHVSDPTTSHDIDVKKKSLRISSSIFFYVSLRMYCSLCRKRVAHDLLLPEILQSVIGPSMTAEQDDLLAVGFLYKQEQLQQ